MSNNTDILIWRRGDAYPANWPEWLKAADIGWCRVEIMAGGWVVWHDGDWHAGTWHYGIWHDGEWHDGEWHDGEWHDGEWYDGEEWRDDGPPRRR